MEIERDNEYQYRIEGGTIVAVIHLSTKKKLELKETVYSHYADYPKSGTRGKIVKFHKAFSTAEISDNIVEVLWEDLNQPIGETPMPAKFFCLETPEGIAEIRHLDAEITLHKLVIAIEKKLVGTLYDDKLLMLVRCNPYEVDALTKKIIELLESYRS